MSWRRTVLLALLTGLPACDRPRQPPQGPAGVGDSLRARAESLYARERYDSASAVWTEVLQLARRTRDEPAEARALTGLGSAEYRLGDDVRGARHHSEEGLAITRRLGLTGNLAEAYLVLGLIALEENRNEEGARLFDEAIAAGRAAYDTLAMVRGFGNHGLTATYLGDHARAIEDYRTQRSLARAVGNKRYEANSFTNEAMEHIWEGNPRPAIAQLDTARALYRPTGYATGEHFALAQLATAYELTGEYDRAFAALDTALPIARRLGLRNQEAEDLRLLAGLHVAVGDYRRAIGYYDEAEQRMRSSGFESARASALRGSAAAHLRLGNLRRASASAAEALRLHTASGERLDQLDDLLLLAEIDFHTGGLGKAEPRLRAALTLADQLDTRGTRITVALAEAHLADLARNPRRVLRALRGAEPDMAAGDFGAEWEANALEARAHARLGELDSAAAAGRRAVAAVERLRGTLASEVIRTTYVADRAEVYSDLVVVLLRLGRTEEAFGVADGARSRELLGQLAVVRREANSGTLPGELLEADVLLRRIDDLVQKLRESTRGRRRERGNRADSADAALVASLANARGEYEALLIRAGQEQPRAAVLLGSQAVDLKAVRSALEPDEVLLDYLITADRAFVFVVTRDTMRVVQTELTAGALTNRVRLLRDLWGAPGREWRWALGAARGLHHTLIAPLQDAGVLRGGKRLLIVPHGILGQIPFAALVDERTGHYLVQDYTISSLPSAAALAALRRRAAATSDWSLSAAGLAPFPEELPATRLEVEAFRASLTRATVQLGPQATEAAMRRALARPGLVHVATHGVLNAANPMFSRIELARAGPNAADDGRLEAYEVLGLTIRSPLVYLSGCETGAGPLWTDSPVRGAAELTLAQSFLSAGAGNVILTLWRIDDAGAAAFAGRFYRLLQHRPLAEALAVAQRETAGDSRYNSPYYWAGYVLTGAGRLGPGAQTVSSASVGSLQGGPSPSAVVMRRAP
jgi:CHAT domain-containing protein